VRDDADDRDAFVLDGRIDARWIEGLVDDGGRTVDRAAEQDREAPNVKQRQAREPTVVLPYAEIEGGTDGAPEVVSVGQHRPLWRARGAGGVDEGVRGTEVEVGYPSPLPPPRWRRGGTRSSGGHF